MSKHRAANLLARRKPTSKPTCSQGTACGNSCISSTFVCYDILSPAAQLIASSLVSLTGVLKASSHTGSLYSYTAPDGSQYFAKRFASSDKSWQNELRAYKQAEQLGIAGMLVKARVVDLGNDEKLLLWPMLKGSTLRDYGRPLTEQQLDSLAIARQYDELIRNPDRNRGNIWITDSGQVRLIDNDLAYVASGPLMSHGSRMTLAEAQARLPLQSLQGNKAGNRAGK